ncbi:MAG: Sec-independent protein translocase protein TatB [Candidatus Puniceispirillaceae bacterium]|jgi:sec-independent protein translocase protein TatB
MLDIGGWEFLVVAFVLIMVVGPKELPKMLRGFTNLTKQMRRMAREFTDGMNQIAADAEVADIKEAMNKAKSGDLDELADTIDPGGTVGKSMREMKDSVSGTGASDEMKEIGELASEAGDRIAADAKEDDKPETEGKS